MSSGTQRYLVGRYQLIKEIGKGGFGAVEEYTDLVCNENVAIKTIPARFVNQESRRLVREIDIMSFLHDLHPHVIGYYTMFVTQAQNDGSATDSMSAAKTLENTPPELNMLGFEYEGLSEDAKALRHHEQLLRTVGEISCNDDSNVHIVMPLMKGDLFYFIRLLASNSGPQKLNVTHEFLAQVAVVFAFQICFGLDYLHQCAIIHRDMKPDNVLVRLDISNPYMSTALIADMGLARDAQHSDTIYICTRYYRPPEVITSVSRGSTRIDIWSLGCIFYEMCTGQTLFTMRTALNERGEWDGAKASMQLEVILNIIGTPSSEEVERYMPAGNAKSYLLRSTPRPSQLRDRICKNWILKVNDAQRENWIDLITRCVSFFPEQRPTAQQLCQHQLFRDYNVFYGENVKQYEPRHYIPSAPANQDATRAENKAAVLSIVKRVLSETPPVVSSEEELSGSDEELLEDVEEEEEEEERGPATQRNGGQLENADETRPAGYSFAAMSTRIKNDYGSLYAEEDNENEEEDPHGKAGSYGSRYTPGNVFRSSSMLRRSAYNSRSEPALRSAASEESGPVLTCSFFFFFVASSHLCFYFLLPHPLCFFLSVLSVCSGVA